MDSISQKFAEQIEKMVLDCLNSLPNLSEEQKSEASGKIRNYLNQVILDTLIDNLNESQFNQLDALDPNSPEMVAKITEIASQIPNLAFKFDEKLQQSCQQIKQTQQIPAI